MIININISQYLIDIYIYIYEIIFNIDLKI